MTLNKSVHAMTNLSLRVLLFSLVAVLLSACARQDAGPGDDAPNIVLVTLDCLRADRLAAHGGDPEWMPNVNALAAKGTVFLNAYTAAGTTFPSHATMLTGLYPRFHGVRSNKHTLSDDFTTVAEILSAEGYTTGSFVSFRQMHFLGNMGQGFTAQSDRERKPTHGHVRYGETTTKMAVDWVRDIESRNDADPFFLWMHLFDAHGPYLLTDWSREQLGDYDGPLKDGANLKELKDRRHELLASERDLDALETLYTGEVHKIDAHVGELLSVLEEAGELDNSIVIVVSDHGQGIGESGHLGHGPTLREDVLHIPLIITDLRTQEHREVTGFAGTVDLTPTILDIVGVSSSIQFQGRSLLPAIENGEIEEAPYYAEVERQPGADYGSWYSEDQLAVYDSGFKLLHDSGNLTLFDLSSDPMAQNPLDSQGHVARVDYMGGLAKDYLAQEVDSKTSELTPEDLETLRSLGYIQ